MTFDWRSDIIEPVRRAVIRLFRPDVRIVTGGIAFYALFSIFPLIYPALTLLTVFLPPELAVQLAAPIRNFFSQNVEALSMADVDVIGNMTPAGLSLRAFGALILLLITATSGARAAIIGIRMIAGAAGRTGFARFQGVSLLLTGPLVLLVWLPGALQLIITVISAEGGYETGQFAGGDRGGCRCAVCFQGGCGLCDLLSDPGAQPARTSEQRDEGHCGRRGGGDGRLRLRDVPVPTLS